MHIWGKCIAAGVVRTAQEARAIGETEAMEEEAEEELVARSVSKEDKFASLSFGLPTMVRMGRFLLLRLRCSH